MSDKQRSAIEGQSSDPPCSLRARVCVEQHTLNAYIRTRNNGCLRHRFTLSLDSNLSADHSFYSVRFSADFQPTAGWFTPAKLRNRSRASRNESTFSPREVHGSKPRFSAGALRIIADYPNPTQKKTEARIYEVQLEK